MTLSIWSVNVLLLLCRSVSSALLLFLQTWLSLTHISPFISSFNRWATWWKSPRSTWTASGRVSARASKATFPSPTSDCWNSFTLMMRAEKQRRSHLLQLIPSLDSVLSCSERKKDFYEHTVYEPRSYTDPALLTLPRLFVCTCLMSFWWMSIIREFSLSTDWYRLAFLFKFNFTHLLTSLQTQKEIYFLDCSICYFFFLLWAKMSTWQLLVNTVTSQVM